MADERKPIADPDIVLREELDEWGLIFDPDKNDIFTLNPVGTFIWKHLDGKHTKAEIASELRTGCENAPENTEQFVDKFVDGLEKAGFLGYELKKE